MRIAPILALATLTLAACSPDGEAAIDGTYALTAPKPARQVDVARAADKTLLPEVVDVLHLHQHVAQPRNRCSSP